ncbi:SiaC family regulatory phosphoprotein [Ekhidna sp.]|uniref:SiaC family regulatory phosphoprotein n=1 Tax=Ekhidna sp. TaxID=2608089 RepID=UPI003C7DDBD9
MIKLDLPLINRIEKRNFMVVERSLDLEINEQHGICMLKGWSVGYERASHYEEMLSFIETHLEENDRLTAYFGLDFFDKASLKYLFKIINLLNEKHQKGKKVNIKWSWRMSSSLMKLSGEDFKELSDFPFEIFEE